ncbi:MAG: DEAD/DEAH box helicase [Pirellulales bacterium]|nr:DEAD/DEAH box helicase [Pirellulales bacterium]
MAIDDFLRFMDERFSALISARTVLDPSSGDFVEFPPALDSRLVNVLRGDGIERIYSHQRDALEAISAGRDTLLVSRTASGKTLSFLLPILNDYLQAEAPFGTMLMYPTKALSRDQEGTLGKLLDASGAEVRLGVFDGDTPREERTRIQASADFMITNPDMLHSGILPNHNRRWRTFLSRLKYVVIDEVHSYRGAFGSHVANVFRRLLRVCAIHGSRPTFICSSATIGNPAEHVQALFGREFAVIEKDGAPRPRRDLYLVNPPVVQSHGHALYRKGTGSVSVPLLREATRRGIRTICFCRARQQAERLHQAVIDGHPDLRDRVKPYRGGLLPNERRRLERDLANGRLTTIISTNALELGINIGDLDLCVLSGHPGSMASFWQQAGRVGRKASRAVVVYIARDAPIDQYFVNHPEFLGTAPIERAWLNADNPYILLQHLPCAAHEHPLREDEPAFPEPAYPAAVEILKENDVLANYKENYRYALRDYPAKGVNLRGMTDYNVNIYEDTEVIGELDPIGARGTLYKDAIYQHLGKRYMSMELDLEKKLCRVEQVDVDYYTEAVWESRVTMTEPLEDSQLHGAATDFGYVNVNRQPKLYKKIRERTFENIGYGPITLDAFVYDTTGFCLRTPPVWRAAVEAINKLHVGAALYGLSYILKQTAPSLCLGDVQNIETDVSLAEGEPGKFQSALFLFDTIEGGVGYAEKIFEVLPQAFQLCQSVLEDCPCAIGCPACITPLPPGVNDEDLEQLLVETNAALACTKSLLTALVNGSVELPEVLRHEIPNSPRRDPPEPDREMLRLKDRLAKANRILDRKRSRVH